jgi:hypothetical protein
MYVAYKYIKQPLGRKRRMWWVNIKMIFMKIHSEDGTWMVLPQISDEEL